MDAERFLIATRRRSDRSHARHAKPGARSVGHIARQGAVGAPIFAYVRTTRVFGPGEFRRFRAAFTEDVTRSRPVRTDRRSHLIPHPGYGRRRTGRARARELCARHFTFENMPFDIIRWRSHGRSPVLIEGRLNPPTTRAAATARAGPPATCAYVLAATTRENNGGRAHGAKRGAKSTCPRRGRPRSASYRRTGIGAIASRGVGELAGGAGSASRLALRFRKRARRRTCSAITAHGNCFRRPLYLPSGETQPLSRSSASGAERSCRPARRYTSAFTAARRVRVSE